eukprot:7686522-Pyramimonas_sp.AAC.1
MLGGPQLDGHPVRDRDDWRSIAIPLSIHGDGAPVTGLGKIWQQSALIYSWCSVFASGSTRSFNFLIGAIFR